MQRDGGLVSGWLILALAASLLTLEGLLPGNAFLPLTPDDFPAWAAGRSPETLSTHPHPNWCMSDVLHLFVPGLATTRAALDRRELPEWDPSQALGVPHIDEVHYAVYYPPAWLPLLFGFKGLGLMAWLHVLVAGGGMLLYLRALKRTQSAALMGALAFALSGWMTARLHAFPVVGAAVWLPWVLYGLERGAQRGRALPYAVAAVALALSFLAGFPQISLLVAGMAVLLEVVRPWAAWRRGQAALGPALRAGIVFLLAVLLAAPQLWPTRDYVENHSARAEQSVQAVAADGLDLALLTHLVAPDYLATTGLAGPHPLAMEHAPSARAAPVSVNRAETSMGIGVMGLLLSLVALVFGKRWVTRTFAAVLLVAMGLLLSPAALEFCATYVPGLRYGSPKRLLFLTTFAMSVLCAGGLDLLRQERLRYVVLCWVTALAATIFTLMLLVSVPSSEEPADIERWATELGRAMEMGPLSLSDIFAVVPPEAFAVAGQAAFRSAALAFAAALAAILLFRPRSAPSERGWVTRIESMPGIVPAVLALELAAAALPMLRAAPLEGITADASRIERLGVPQLASAARSTESESKVPPRILRVGNDPSYLRPNFPGLFGLHDVQAYAPMIPLRVAELLESVMPGARLSGSILGGVLDTQSLSLPALDMLGVNAVLTDDPALMPSGFELHEAVGHVNVLRNTEALPRAFLASRFSIVPDKALRLARLASPNFQPQHTILLEEAPLGLPDAEVYPDGRLLTPPVEGVDAAEVPASKLPQVSDGSARPRNVTVTFYEPGQARVAVGPGAPGMLVFSESWHPGWTARVDGKITAVQRANHALLGIPVATAEKVVVELSYEPGTTGVGLMAGGAGFLGLGVLLLVGGVLARRRNREGAAIP